MPRHFRPVILYDDEHTFELPIDKKEKVHDMLRTNGQLWTVLASSSPSSSSFLFKRHFIDKSQSDSHKEELASFFIHTATPSSSSSSSSSAKHQRRHQHRRYPSQDSTTSSLSSGVSCRTPLEIEDLPLSYPHSPNTGVVLADDDDDDDDNDNDNNNDDDDDYQEEKQTSPSSPIKKKRNYTRRKPSSQETVLTITSPGGDRIRKRRGNLPKSITCLLKEWLMQHTHHPYPSDDEKLLLQQKTNLTINQISNWFINARRRLLPNLISDTPTSSSCSSSSQSPSPSSSPHVTPEEGLKNKRKFKRQQGSLSKSLKKSNMGGVTKRHPSSPYQRKLQRPSRSCRQQTSLFHNNVDEAWINS